MIEMLLEVGDVVQMKKKHPCGSDQWEIVFVGSDIKMRCAKCRHVVMLDRPTFDKRCRRILSSAKEGTEHE